MGLSRRSSKLRMFAPLLAVSLAFTPSAASAQPPLQEFAAQSNGTSVQTTNVPVRPGVLSIPTTLRAKESEAQGKRYKKLYVDAHGSAVNAVKQAKAQGRTSVAKRLSYISRTPQARWFGDWNSVASVKKDVATYVRAANKAKSRPTIVLYAIPGRDCGQYSAGGFDAKTYKKWINKVAAGIKGAKPLIVLEPDSLALDCGGKTRNNLLKYATKKLTEAGAWVYLDGGHSNWRTPAAMAKRLKAAGISHARGFATNVSNFNSTPAEKSYAQRVSAALKKQKVTAVHRHYIVDTSRNGKGSRSGEWCNPSGRGLGKKPKLHTGSSALDGLLWIKRPGESDGTCNGGPSAGQWWESYALTLVKNRAK